MPIGTFLNLKADLQRKTLTEDGAGGHTAGWDNLLLSVPVAVQPMPTRERVAQQQLGRELTHHVYCRTKQHTPPGLSANTVPEIIRAGGECRLKVTTKGSTRFLAIRGVMDTDEDGQFVRIEALEMPHREIVGS